MQPISRPIHLPPTCVSASCLQQPVSVNPRAPINQPTCQSIIQPVNQSTFYHFCLLKIEINRPTFLCINICQSINVSLGRCPNPTFQLSTYTNVRLFAKIDSFKAPAYVKHSLRRFLDIRPHSMVMNHGPTWQSRWTTLKNQPILLLNVAPNLLVTLVDNLGRCMKYILETNWNILKWWHVYSIWFSRLVVETYIAGTSLLNYGAKSPLSTLPALSTPCCWFVGF